MTQDTKSDVAPQATRFLMRLPGPFQVVFSAAGLLFVWAGAATFVQDMSGIVGWLQAHVGGLWLLVVGAVSVFFGLAPSVIEWFRGGRSVPPRTDPVRLNEVEDEVYRLRLESNRLKGELGEKADLVHDLGNELERARAVASSYSDLHERYERLRQDHAGCAARLAAATVASAETGSALEPPSIARQMAIVRVGEARAAMDDAVASLGRLWRRLAEEDHRPSSVQNWLSRCLEATYVEALRMSRENVDATLQGGDHTLLEEVLADLYGAYNALRNTVRLFAQRTDQDLALLSQYRVWLQSDDAFFRAFESLRVQPTMESLGARIARLTPENRTPSAMPPLRPPPSLEDLKVLQEEGRALVRGPADAAWDVEQIREWVTRVCGYLRARRGDEDVVAFGGDFEIHSFAGLSASGMRLKVEQRVAKLEEIVAKYWSVGREK